MQESSCLAPAQALSVFVALSHENSKIACPQTAKCGVKLTHDHLSAISGITLDGRLVMQVREDAYDADGVVGFLRVLLQLIGRQVQTHLDERMIKHCVLFAARRGTEASQIRQHGPDAVGSSEPQQGAFPRELARREGRTDGPEGLTQCLPGAPVAPVPKRAEPLDMGVLMLFAPYAPVGLDPRIATPPAPQSRAPTVYRTRGGPS